MPYPAEKEPVDIANKWDDIKIYFYRWAACRLLPARWFEGRLPTEVDRARRTGKLHLELVSHCWGYAHMMVYQLSSLVLHPPIRCKVTMTVFYSPDDTDTAKLLSFFENENVPNVTWNWQPLHRYQLFRRSIGRNQAALGSLADWVWFTDCDLLFNHNCLDTLTDQLQGSAEILVYPVEERTTTLLAADDPVLKHGPGNVTVNSINAEQFESHRRTRATGPLQITHGDVARACGYCDSIPVFQKAARHWCKAHEDRVFRWLLGTQGTGVSVPGVYRIRHIEKGRYKGESFATKLRITIRRWQSVIRGE